MHPQHGAARQAVGEPRLDPVHDARNALEGSAAGVLFVSVFLDFARQPLDDKALGLQTFLVRRHTANNLHPGALTLFGPLREWHLDLFGAHHATLPIRGLNVAKLVLRPAEPVISILLTPIRRLQKVGGAVAQAAQPVQPCGGFRRQSVDRIGGCDDATDALVRAGRWY
jgi:hypothetical protein